MEIMNSGSSHNNAVEEDLIVCQNLISNNQKSSPQDNYCWSCHQIIKLKSKLSCKACVRSYHLKCLSDTAIANCNHSISGFSCQECVAIVSAEQLLCATVSGDTHHTSGRLNDVLYLLKYAIERIKVIDSEKLFHTPVDTELYPDYCDKVVKPMDLSKIERNIRNCVYASTNSFLADIKWIHHNCVVYNPTPNEFIEVSRKLLQRAMEECEDMETCADCYKHYFEYNAMSYFREACRKPHGIVWAKLSGYPYWPAKAIKYHNIEDKVLVVFFGTRNKSWISLRNCYLMSKTCPTDRNTWKVKDHGLALNQAIRDLNMHIVFLNNSFPKLFRYWPMKTPFTREHLYLTHNQTLVKKYNNVELKNLRVRAQTFEFSADLLLDHNE